MGNNQHLTDLDERIIEISKRDQGERDLCLICVLVIHKYDLEEDVREYLADHPHASFDEIDRFVASLCPDVEIVDDED